MIISEKDKTYHCTGTHCSETCNINLYQRKIGNSSPLTNRQYDNSVLLGKNGGNSQSGNAASCQLILDYLLTDRITVTAEYLPSSLNI